MSRRKLLNEEELQIVNKNSYVTNDEEGFKLFYEDCQLRNLRPHTFKFYREGLKPFHGRPIVTMTERDIKNMILEMQQKGLKVATINAKLRAYRSFFNFLYKNKHIKQNPIANVKLLKGRKEIVQTFSKEQLEKLFSLCDFKTFVGVRDYTIMTLFLDTGIRLNELINIELEDVKADKVIIRETKTYFQREVPITKKCSEQLEMYIKIRGRADTEKLFINQDGKELKKRSVQSRFESYAKQSGIANVRISAHTFRHTFAKFFIQQGGNAFHLQQILGHTSLEITKIYVNLFATDVAEAHTQYSPLNSIIKR